MTASVPMQIGSLFSGAVRVDGADPTDDLGLTAEARKNSQWRVTIHDTRRLGDDLCHIDTITCYSTNPLDILRAALDAYRDHRGPTPEPNA